jgi:Suppressor of fused protein (SUFU)
VLKHGDTSGPLPPVFAPMTNIIFIELGNGRIPFEFGGRRYGLLLLQLITDSEVEFKKQHGSEALIKRLRAARSSPVSDPNRAPVA